ncbi:DUF1796 family putative cysteine peptidase [Butyrivibrio sp. INlla14]|uniref:DUF1796 family putative cysteine peptidase n=1 Tax=Butyrivibrio sp. INlla14 TaxID=1520808 RepID=UPI000876FD8D|nr:DUF1796 family putative cysteine peptidase [Butyrivibrio sp. INlla14]SCY71400.1 Putative papain-like cysteine peptidase [Butyrivibrio sp. INlla14]
MYEEEEMNGEYFCDLMIPIGMRCRPAENLKLNYLRDFSMPLDWMMDYSLDTVIHLFQTGFSDFFRNIELDKEKPLKAAAGMLRINDINNHIISIHHFPQSMWLIDSQPRFIEKMDFRAKRLELYLKQSSNIVLVSCREETKEDMCFFLQMFSKIYPHLKIRLINIRHNERMPYDSYKKENVFDEGKLSYIEYTLNDTEQGRQIYQGNIFVWSKILGKYITSNSFAIRMQWKQLRDHSAQIVIYGAGTQCARVLYWLSNIGINVDGIAVSSMMDNPEEINKLPVRMYSVYPKDVTMVVSIGDKSEAKKIKRILNEHEYKYVYLLDYNMRPISDEE